MSDRPVTPPITAEQAARIAPGLGTVVHRKPLTVVVSTDGDPDATARGITAVVDELVAGGELTFGPVAAGLQQFVVDHQPSGVAAILDVAPDAIAFLFDSAAAIGTSTTHRAAGRSGWTTVFIEGESVSLIAGPGPERPVDPWSRMWAGTVSGQGVQVDLTRSSPPAPPSGDAPPVDDEIGQQAEVVTHDPEPAWLLGANRLEKAAADGQTEAEPLVGAVFGDGGQPLDEVAGAFQVVTVDRDGPADRNGLAGEETTVEGGAVDGQPPPAGAAGEEGAPDDGPTRLAPFETRFDETPFGRSAALEPDTPIDAADGSAAEDLGPEEDRLAGDGETSERVDPLSEHDEALPPAAEHAVVGHHDAAEHDQTGHDDVLEHRDAAEHQAVEHRSAAEHEAVEHRDAAEHNEAAEHRAAVGRDDAVEHRSAAEHEAAEHRSAAEHEAAEHRAAAEHNEAAERRAAVGRDDAVEQGDALEQSEEAERGDTAGPARDVDHEPDGHDGRADDDGPGDEGSPEDEARLEGEGGPEHGDRHVADNGAHSESIETDRPNPVIELDAEPIDLSSSAMPSWNWPPPQSEPVPSALASASAEHPAPRGDGSVRWSDPGPDAQASGDIEDEAADAQRTSSSPLVDAPPIGSPPLVDPPPVMDALSPAGAIPTEEPPDDPPAKKQPKPGGLAALMTQYRPNRAEELDEQRSDDAASTAWNFSPPPTPADGGPAVAPPTPTGLPTSQPTPPPEAEPIAGPPPIPTGLPTSRPTPPPEAKPIAGPPPMPTGLPTSQPTPPPEAEPIAGPPPIPGDLPPPPPGATPIAGAPPMPDSGKKSANGNEPE